MRVVDESPSTLYSVESKYRLYANIAAANQHKLNSINQRKEPRHEKEHVKIVMQPSFRDVGQTYAKWQTLEKHENKRKVYDSKRV